VNIQLCDCRQRQVFLVDPTFSLQTQGSGELGVGSGGICVLEPLGASVCDRVHLLWAWPPIPAKQFGLTVFLRNIQLLQFCDNRRLLFCATKQKVVCGRDKIEKPFY
jgi:hypothetical protein